MVGVQEIRWDDSNTLESGYYTLFYVELSFLFIDELGQQLEGWDRLVGLVVSMSDY